jgi:hypothetical protein
LETWRLDGDAIDRVEETRPDPRTPSGKDWACRTRWRVFAVWPRTAVSIA